MPHRQRIIAAAASLALLAGIPGSALGGDTDGDQLLENTDTTWTIQLDANTLVSESVTRLKNLTKPTIQKVACGKGRTCKKKLRWYFDGWGPYFIPRASLGTEVGGKDVTATKGEASGVGELWKVSFPKLWPKQTRTVTAAFVTPTNNGIEDSDPARIEDGYLHLCWFGQVGDTGTTTLRLPPGYVNGTYSGEVYQTGSLTDGFLLEAASTLDPSSFMACTEAFETARMGHTYVVGESGHSLLDIVAWPGHDAWAADIAGTAGTALAHLEATMGRDLPGNHLTIRESSREARLFGLPDEAPAHALLRVSEDIPDPQTIGTAMARTFFGPEVIAEPWLATGLAMWQGYDAFGLDCPEAIPGPADLDDGWLIIPGWSDVTQRDGAWAQSVAACRIVEHAADAMGDESMIELLTLAGGLEPVAASDWLTLATANLADPEPFEALLAQAGIER